jgi:hypothetical protein
MRSGSCTSCANAPTRATHLYTMMMRRGQAHGASAPCPSLMQRLMFPDCSS